METIIDLDQSEKELIIKLLSPMIDKYKYRSIDVANEELACRYFEICDSLKTIIYKLKCAK